MQITDDQLLAAIRAFGSEDAVQVQEFDDCELLPAVGVFVELAGPLSELAQ